MTAVITPKRKRGNPSGKGNEVALSRAYLRTAGIEGADLTDVEAVNLSERVAKADVCCDAIGIAIEENWNVRRVFECEERARLAVQGVPARMRPAYLARIERALSAQPIERPAPVRVPETLADILKAERKVLAKRRCAGTGFGR